MLTSAHGRKKLIKTPGDDFVEKSKLSIFYIIFHQNLGFEKSIFAAKANSQKLLVKNVIQTTMCVLMIYSG